MKKFLLLFILSLWTLSMKADKIDSLINELNKASDEEKISVYNQLSHLIKSRSLDTALIFAEQALEIAEKEKNTNGAVNALYNIGNVYYYRGNYDEALHNFDMGIKRIGNKDNKLSAKLFNRKGAICQEKGEYSEAEKYYKKCLQICVKTDNKNGMSVAYNNIGNTYYLTSDFKSAVEYYQKSAEIEEELGNIKGAAMSTFNIGNIYFMLGNMKKSEKYMLKALDVFQKFKDYIYITGAYINLGQIYVETGELKKAVYYLIKAINISEEQGYTLREAQSYLTLGTAYEKLGNIEKALSTYKVALKLAKNINEKLAELEALDYIGNIYTKQKQYKQALKCFEQGENIAVQINNPYQLKEIYSSKSETYGVTGDYKNAFKYHKLFTQIKDSIFNEEKNKQITEIETKYQTEKKEKEIIKLSDENSKQKLIILKNRYFSYSLFILIIIILLFGILLFRNNKIKNRQKTLELEQKLFRSQMNPHFIFNSLASIQTFIIKNKAIEAGAYLSDFAKLMRHVIENSKEEYISLEQEIETMKYYLQMQKLRFEYHFSYTFEIDKSLETEYVLIPPMLTQPFIENALEHAFSKNKNENNLYIRYTRQNGFLKVEVEDNGIGRKKALSTKKSKHKSFALSLTKSRLENLNRKKKNKINFEIIDLVSDTGNPSGTKVKFNIPLKYSD